MGTTKPFPIHSSAGVRRDGTQLDGTEHVAALWTRWYRSRPRKMQGYQAVTSTLPEVVRGMNSYTADAVNFLSMGGATTLTQVQTDQSGVFGGQNDRTPGALVASPDNLWQMDTFISAVGGPNSLVAHAAPNLSDIASTQERSIWAGDVTGVAALTAVGMDPNSGGIVAIYPYLFGYGNSGRVDVSNVNDYSTNDSAYVTGQKIVRGMRLRGGGGGPAGLFWSLDSLVRATFNAAILTGIPFDFDIITDDTSILSSQGVLEYDGIYYWMGTDRFLMFNGVVREVPNTMNLDFFFDNLNFTWRQKAFVYKVPRRGEIWFCAPLGNATECNHAIVLNVRENCWYDTPLPDSGRSTGYSPRVYNKPWMTDLDLTSTGYTLWQHETGLDKVSLSQTVAIKASFTTSEINSFDWPQDTGKALRLDFIEPDFVQAGPMTVQVLGRTNARSNDYTDVTVTFQEDGTGSPQQQALPFKVNARLLRFTFESNSVGGDFYMGKTVGHIETTDGRFTQ